MAPLEQVRTFLAKNSVERSLSLISSPSAGSVNVNWSLNWSTTSTKLPCLQAA